MGYGNIQIFRYTSSTGGPNRKASDRLTKELTFRTRTGWETSGLAPENLPHTPCRSGNSGLEIRRHDIIDIRHEAVPVISQSRQCEWQLYKLRNWLNRQNSWYAYCTDYFPFIRCSMINPGSNSLHNFSNIASPRASSQLSRLVPWRCSERPWRH